MSSSKQIKQVRVAVFDRKCVSDLHLNTKTKDLCILPSVALRPVQLSLCLTWGGGGLLVFSPHCYPLRQLRAEPPEYRRPVVTLSPALMSVFSVLVLLLFLSFSSCPSLFLPCVFIFLLWAFENGRVANCVRTDVVRCYAG